MTLTRNIKDTPLEEALNFDRLKYKGLEYVKELAGELWTNFNDSDPGVTILDQLCYGLTELGYCNNFPIEDILSEQTGKIEFEGQFFSPEQILTTSPVTIDDYQKLVIDSVSEVKNVEIIPLGCSGGYQIRIYPQREYLYMLQRIRTFMDTLLKPGCTNSHVFYGQFFRILKPLKFFINVLLDPDGSTGVRSALESLFNSSQISVELSDSQFISKLKSIRNDINQFQNILNKVQGCLNRHRNLSELFYTPGMLIPKNINLNGTFYIKSQQSIESIKARINVVLENYAFAETKQNGYQALIDSGVQVNDIFNGPKLNNGWILTSDLGQKRDTVHLYELIKLVEGIEGVASFSQAKLFIEDKEGQEQKISIAKGEVAFIHLDCQFIQDKQLVPETEKDSVTEFSTSFNLSTLKNLTENKSIVAHLDVAPPKPKGKPRYIADYYSIQNTFPSHYGIGEEQLSDAVGAERIAQVRQLKGYLMVFDQLLANQFSQLSNTAELFSFAPVSTLATEPKKFAGIPYQLFPPTYFCQPLYNVPDVKLLLKGHNSYDFGFVSGDDGCIEGKKREAEVWKKFKQDPFNQYMMGLRNCMEDPDELDDRRNRMLDHLLARHGESGALYDEIITRTRWYADQVKTRIIVKTLILQNYQKLSYYRTNAYNFYQADALSIPGRYCLGIMDAEQLQKVSFDDKLLDVYKRIVNQVFSSKFSFLTRVVNYYLAESSDQCLSQNRNNNLFSETHIKYLLSLLDDSYQLNNAQKNEVQKRLNAVETSLPLAQIQHLLLQLKDNLIPDSQQPIFINGQIELKKLAAKEALTSKDFDYYSTFELQTNLLLGLVVQYELLIDLLRSLLNNEGFKSWLGDENRADIFELKESYNHCSIHTSTKEDILYMGNKPLLTLKLLSPDGSRKANYQAHLDQLIWFAQKRKGLLLIENQLLAEEDHELVALLRAQFSIDLTVKLSCLLILPAYVHLFNPLPVEKGINLANEFDTDWDLLVANYWPCHVENNKQWGSFEQLYKLIPKYVAWHNQLRGKDHFAASTSLRGANVQ